MITLQQPHSAANLLAVAVYVGGQRRSRRQAVGNAAGVTV
jgi:hypothetical protein